LDGLPDGCETETAGDTISLDIHVVILELYHAIAIDTHQMVVGWLLEEIRIVGDLALSKIDLAKQVCFYQQAECPVN
ncbi:hypothetical protein Q4550_24290, partial [Anaerobacillus sp. 1_MG-2023]